MYEYIYIYIYVCVCVCVYACMYIYEIHLKSYKPLPDFRFVIHSSPLYMPQQRRNLDRNLD